jgi:sortase A
MMFLSKWVIRAGLVAGLLICLDALYMPAKAILAQRLLNHAWDTTKATGKVVKPWPWADTEPLARIIFPRQGKDYIVLAGSMGRTLAFAPGHITGTALPHELGHIAISAHRDSHFEVLRELTIGDLVGLETLTGELRQFRISRREVVDSRKSSLIIELNKTRLSLITCYPFDSIEVGGPLRLQFDAIPVSEKAQKN